MFKRELLPSSQCTFLAFLPSDKQKISLAKIQAVAWAFLPRRRRQHPCPEATFIPASLQPVEDSDPVILVQIQKRGFKPDRCSPAQILPKSTVLEEMGVITNYEHISILLKIAIE